MLDGARRPRSRPSCSRSWPGPGSTRPRRLPARRESPLAGRNDPFQARGRRLLDAVRPAHDLPDAVLHPGLVGLDRDRIKEYMVAFLVLETTDDRRLRGARSRPVLPVLRGRPDPDVPDHRRLGRQAARLRRLQVLPLHAARLGADAARRDGDVLGRRHDRHRRAAAAQVRAEPPNLALARLLRLARGKDADVAGPHLASRRACRGADRRLGDPRRHPAEDGRLRLHPLLVADVPGRLGRRSRRSSTRCRSSPSSTPPWSR